MPLHKYRFNITLEIEADNIDTVHELINRIECDIGTITNVYSHHENPPDYPEEDQEGEDA